MKTTTPHGRLALTAGLAAVLALALALPATAHAQETGTYVLMQGGNEVASESFTRTATALRTALEIPGQQIIATDASLGDDGAVTGMELRILPAASPDAEPLQSTAVAFSGDSARVESPIGTPVGSAAAVLGTIPYPNPSPAYMEQILRRARAMGGDSATLEIWVPSQGTGQVVPARVAFEGNSATLSFGTVAIEIETDGEGRLLAGEVPAQGLVIERR